MAFDRVVRAVPSARVVREAGAEVAPPSPPFGEQLREAFGPLAARGRDALAVVIGMWPLTAVAAVAAALIWSAGT